MHPASPVPNIPLLEPKNPIKKVASVHEKIWKLNYKAKTARRPARPAPAMWTELAAAAPVD